MIILSGVLVVVAIALLVTGIVTGNTGHEVAGLDGLKLIYISIGVSIISALCLAIGVFLRRKELFGRAESVTLVKRTVAGRSGRAARPAKTKTRVGADGDAPTLPATPATVVDVPAETSVYVVPGRKRYHLETCRQLAGRDKEELTFAEAREEGFTACTACLPDMALAARAASESTGKPDVDAANESPEAGREDDDPALATRTDLPVTRLDSDTAEFEPIAESPAAIPPDDEVPAPDTADIADTARLDQVAEASEAAPEPPVEQPSAHSRSFFEPIDSGETVPAGDGDTAEAADATQADTGDEEPAVADAGDELPGDEDDDVRPEPAETEEPDSAFREDAEPTDQGPADEESEPEPAESSATTEPAEVAEEPLAEADDAGEADETQETGETGDEDRPEEDAAEAEPADHQNVRILSGTKRYHRFDCALIEDIAEDADDLETLPQAEAKDRGCTPCLVCQPDKDLTDE